MLVKSSHNDPRGSLQYAEYINKNPLYIHNHKWYFENTLRNLNLMDSDPFNEAITASTKYIKYLENREKRILKAIGGKDKLEIVARDMYVDNENVKEIIKLLDKAFGMNQDVRTSVGRISGEENPFLKIVKDSAINSEKMKKIELITTGTRKAHGRTINVYDYKASAELIKEDGILVQELRRIVNNINEALNIQKDFQTSLKKFVDNETISEDFELDGVLTNYFNTFEKAKGPEIEYLLKFIVDKMGTYSYLKGRYTENAKFAFTDAIKNIFGENFRPESGDKRTREERAGTLKKADIILKGGVIDGKKIPEITISRKAVSAKDYLKFQDSPLKGVQGGIYQALKKESDSVANLYLYLTLNSSFWSNTNANMYLKFFNKIMSYVFISGNTIDQSYQKAVYLIITTGHGDNIETSFVPISSIIKSIIYNDEAEIKITATKKNPDTDISLSGPLWRAKLATVGRRTNKKGRGLRYKILSQDRNVLDQAEQTAGPLLTRNRRIGINYNFLEDAIKSYGIITRSNNG